MSEIGISKVNKMVEKRITIDPVTRLEGHAKIDIILDENNKAKNAYLQVVELRGFETFCKGRPVEEMPRITQRICGVCPSAHHMASTRALDAVFNADVPSAVHKVRELYYAAHQVHSHIAHFYALGGPDFVLGPDAEPLTRNVLGVIDTVGVDIGKAVIGARAKAQDIQRILGGKPTHSVAGLPGGWSRALKEEERDQVLQWGHELVEFSIFSIDEIFKSVVLDNPDYVDLILNGPYYHETYHGGLVDENNQMNFYNGKMRIVDPDGKEFAKFEYADYREHIAEHTEEWSMLKFPYLKKQGWKGFDVQGKEGSIFRVAPLSRLNVTEGMPTPEAHERYKIMYETLTGDASGKVMVQHTLAFHWARLIELLYASERIVELAQDSEITSTKLRGQLRDPTEGVGFVEAPRGTLIHHYKTDEDGMVEMANLIVATAHNNASMNIDVANAARAFITDGKPTHGFLNRVEMAFRAYDPCLGCATHTLPGSMPLEVNIFDKDRNKTWTGNQNIE